MVQHMQICFGSSLLFAILFCTRIASVDAFCQQALQAGPTRIYQIVSVPQHGAHFSKQLVPGKRKSFPLRSWYSDLYDFQLQIASTLEASTSSFSIASAITLAGAGLIASINPCSLSLIPLSVGAVLGTGKESYSIDNKKNQLAMLFLYSMGMILALASVGYGTALLSQSLLSNVGLISGNKTLFISILNVYMGLSILQLVPSVPQITAKLNPQLAEGNQVVNALLVLALGASTAILGSSCTTPVLASILSYIAVSNAPYSASLSMAAYGTGFAIPFILIGLASIANKKYDLSQFQNDWVSNGFGFILIFSGVAGFPLFG